MDWIITVYNEQPERWFGSYCLQWTTWTMDGII